MKTAVQVALEKIESREAIPLMTHPLSRHWDQPHRSEIVVDETHALMSQAAFEKLHDYSCSFPSGVYDGKMWKRGSHYVLNPPFWWLCWYGPGPTPDQCSIHKRKIIVA